MGDYEKACLTYITCNLSDLEVKLLQPHFKLSQGEIINKWKYEIYSKLYYVREGT